jgi:small-conductance mechanosensitive channel
VLNIGIFSTTSSEIEDFLTNPNAYRSLVILAFSLIFAFLLSKLIASLLIKITRFISNKSDNSPSAEKALRLRRTETFMSVLIAVVRVMVIVLVGYIVWRILSPASSSGIAAIGASALFIVVAGATLGLLLRDVTIGSAMITERWYNVGDFIRVEPFLDVTGVVERITLRSTKIRSLNGEVIWMHNQHMQAVKVTPFGVRTLDVDLLCSDKTKAIEIINRAIKTIPKSHMTIADGLKIVTTEKWEDNLWHIVVRGKTLPGREWLIEDYFIKAIKKYDDEYKDKKILVHDPMVRFADPDMEKTFSRAIMAK